MSKKNSELINLYYSLYDVLNDDKLFIDAIKHFTKTTKFKSALAVQLENLRLLKIEEELTMLAYDVSVGELEAFAKRWKLMHKAKKMRSYQSNLFDFI